jgi:hypothetical protein
LSGGSTARRGRSPWRRIFLALAAALIAATLVIVRRRDA